MARPVPPLLQAMSRDELKGLLREALHEELEPLGMLVETGEQRGALAADMRFIRRMRLAIDGAASKVGYAVLLAIAGALISIFALGAKIRFGGG